MVLSAIFSPVVNDQLQQSHIFNLKPIFPPCNTYAIEYLAPQKRPCMRGFHCYMKWQWCHFICRKPYLSEIPTAQKVATIPRAFTNCNNLKKYTWYLLKLVTTVKKIPSEQKLVITSPSNVQMFPMPDSQPQTARHCSGAKCCVNIIMSVLYEIELCVPDWHKPQCSGTAIQPNNETVMSFDH
jgi:hypothetical protein